MERRVAGRAGSLVNFWFLDLISSSKTSEVVLFPGGLRILAPRRDRTRATSSSEPVATAIAA